MPKGEFLGVNAIALIGPGENTGRQLRAVFLQEYDVESDTYVGVAFFQNDEFTKTFEHLGKGVFGEGRTANVAVAMLVPGLRHYPYTARPQADFQFVLAGEDPAPLRAIMQANADKIEQGGDVVIEERQDDQTVDNRPTWQQKGFASKAEWKSAGSPE